MERNRHKKKEILLPTSLVEDIECDELDKELQLIQIPENNENIIKSTYILFYNIFNINNRSSESKRYR